MCRETHDFTHETAQRDTQLASADAAIALPMQLAFVLSRVRQERNIWRAIAMLGEALVESALLRPHDRFGVEQNECDTFYAVLRDVVVRGQREGTIQSALPEMTSTMILSMLLGWSSLVASGHLKGAPFTREQRDGLLEIVVDGLRRGVGVPANATSMAMPTMPTAT